MSGTGSTYESLAPETQKGQSVREAQAVGEDEQGVIEEAEHVDLESSVYGATIFSICFDFYEILTGKDHDGLGIGLNVYRLIFCLIVLIANYIVQMLLLYWVFTYVAMPEVHSAQTIYKKYHADCWEDGVFVWEKWHDWGQDNVDELCRIAFSNWQFMFTIVTLWWIVMVKELRGIDRQWRNFSSIRSTNDPNEMIIRKDDENLVVALTPNTKITLYAFLLLPKFCIAVVLLMIGTVWLTATDSFGSLILNAVVLEFVICVDEIFFEGILPESIHKQVVATKLVLKPKSRTGDPAKDALAAEWKTIMGWMRSTAYFVLVLVGVYCYMFYGQSLPIIGVYPGYAADASCPVYWHKLSHPICEEGENCFPIS